MLQVFLNINVFGMDPQQAVEAPRFASYSFPDSFEPHAYYPGRPQPRSRIDRLTGEALGRARPQGRLVARLDVAGRRRLHDRRRSQERRAHGGADPRRPCYAVGL